MLKNRAISLLTKFEIDADANLMTVLYCAPVCTIMSMEEVASVTNLFHYSHGHSVAHLKLL